MTLDTTQSCDGHEGVPAGNAGTEQLDAQESSHLHVTDPDPASDDDTSRPVRERLKKASIASMPKNDTATKSSSAADDQRLDTNPEESQKRDSPNGQTPSPTAEPRGRLSRKRSYDDTIAADRGASATTTQVHHEEDVSHARKRSRDVRAIQIPSMEAPAITTVQSPLEEGINDEETLDQEIEDSVQSPRKKRSRDEFDVDAHREQKIPATDEAKAYRRSEDSERGQVLQQDDTGATSIDSTTQEKQDTNKGNETLLQQTAPPERAMNPSQSTAQASFPEIASTAVEANPKSSQKPPGGFAASGFAAMSGSSKSPFGTLGTSTPSVFGTKTTTTPSATGTMSTEPHKPQPSTSTFSSSASPFVTSTPGSSGQSGFGFGANGAATKPNSFGGSVFGSAFVNSAAAAPKLTSFAAPTGDLAPSKPAESTKGFGVQTDDSGDEDGGSEVDANPEEVGAGDTEVDGRFQQQEVETGEAGEQSIFLSSRAQLYYFDSGGWHEKGKGAFKLNVAENNEERKARFIMRAHQTFRVLLNQPVFKKMQVGDSKGREPQGKNFSFAVIDQGRPTPHLLKLSDENESKALYREVLRLQQDMETQA